MKKQFYVIFISFIFGFAVLGCGGSKEEETTDVIVNDTTPVSDIIHSQMGSPLVSVKEGIWSNSPEKASMWSQNVELSAGVKEYYVSPTGHKDNSGSRNSP